MKSFVGLGIAVLAWPAAAAAQPPALDQAQFTKLLAVIKPDQQTEKWQQIPWSSSLWEARRQAAREGKPILLWEMDGHPLGCV
ncbi:MAG: hypothetical protein L0Y71_25690 [Gemmataceae bacterium]|nr:hypothetical protein [Gemmataceae bacterium]